MNDHDGRRILVTGAGSGIGQATACLLATQGARVAVGVQAAGDAVATLEHIASTGRAAFPVEVDVTRPDSVQRGVAGAVERLGGLDGVVASAGIQRYGDVSTTDEDTWDEVFAVNVKGAFLTVKAAIPHLRGTPNAAVVVVSSIQAHITQTGVTAYTASKGALNALVRSLAVDEARYGVRVNAVCPGSVDTPMLRWSAAQWGGPSAAEVASTLHRWGQAHPLGRVAQASEVASVISFLLGPNASFITGEDVRVDGGLSALAPVLLDTRERAPLAASDGHVEA